MNKAQQMRGLAESPKNGGGMGKIYASIKERAKLGLKDVCIDCSVMSDTQSDTLKSEGFQVKRVADFRDGDFYKIEW